VPAHNIQANIAIQNEADRISFYEHWLDVDGRNINADPNMAGIEYADVVDEANPEPGLALFPNDRPNPQMMDGIENNEMDPNQRYTDTGHPKQNKLCS